MLLTQSDNWNEKTRFAGAKSAELHEQVAEITNLQAVNATLVQCGSAVHLLRQV